MTNDKDKKKSAKIILFPKGKIKKKITQPQDSPFFLKLKEQQTREFVEGNVDEIGFNLLKKFVDMGLTTTKESFTKDLALVIDCIRGLIYRDFNIFVFFKSVSFFFRTIKKHIKKSTQQ